MGVFMAPITSQKGKVMQVSGHACYTYSMRTGCSYERAAEEIKQQFKKARQISSEQVRREYRKKIDRKRRYFVGGNLIFVLNPTEDEIVTVLVKDPIAEHLYGPILQQEVREENHV